MAKGVKLNEQKRASFADRLRAAGYRSFRSIRGRRADGADATQPLTAPISMPRRM
jgi:hypothetical protein